jgi:hypothetical protein
MRSLRRTLLVASIATAIAGASRAQSAPSVTVRVRVADSTGTPIAGAEVSIVRALTTVVAHGTTDARGVESFTIPRTGADNNLVVRKIGFSRADRFFNDSSSIVFDVRLVRSVRSLDTVKVAAEEDVRRKSYFIDAEGIEKSDRPIVDALDVVMKLRPDMIWGRRGQPDGIGQHGDVRGYRPNAPSARQIAASGAKFGYCPPVQNVWVNGQRQRLIPLNATAALRLTGDFVLMGPLIATVLASVRPEHVEQIEYHPCTDVIENAPPGATNAIFVTLKPGIGYDPGAGSYVAYSPAATHAAIADAVVPSGPARLVGVYDELTGDIIVGAEVVDVASGSFMRTSTTGTATLAFLSAGAKEIRVQKTGYESLTVPVSKDTAPLTVVLKRKS